MQVCTRKTTRALAILAVVGCAMTGCSGTENVAVRGEDRDQNADVLQIGTLLPQTGELSYLLPGPQAAATLAVRDVNDAGGVLGQDVEVVVEADEGDSSDPMVIADSVDDILAADPAFVLGAVGTAMTNAAMPRLTEAGVLMGSPSNSGTALTGVNDLYFRTAPPDSMQGTALGNLIARDGRERVAVLVVDDEYGTVIRDRLEETLNEKDVELVYGVEGAGEEVPTDQTEFSAEAAAVQATDPDAVVVLGSDQTRQIIPALADQDFDLADLYLVDRNTNDFGPETETGGFDPGLLEGAHGMIPGARVDEEFREQLLQVSEETENGELDSVNYAPEAYDAVILVALAAQRGGAADSSTISDNLRAVSGVDGGATCSAYGECLALLETGEEIHYQGRAGIGPMTEDNDPSTAQFGVYEYDENNAPAYASSIEG